MTRTPVAALLAALLLFAACGDDDDGTDAAATTTTTGAEEELRIVSMSASSTEMLFAIGAGDDVVAADSFSNFPAEAPTTDLSAFEPNVEAIAEFDPDLVVLSDDINDVVAGLEALDIETLLQPAAVTLEDTFAQIDELGALTGHQAEASALIDDLRAEIDDLVATVEPRPEPLTYYYELDPTLFSVTSDTFIGELFALAGLENVADPADPDGALGGFPQLSAEFLVQADPSLIFLADTKCCEQDAATLAARAGFAGLSAIANDGVIELDDDVASRWGPRVVDLLRIAVEAANAVA